MVKTEHLKRIVELNDFIHEQSVATLTDATKLKKKLDAFLIKAEWDNIDGEFEVNIGFTSAVNKVFVSKNQFYNGNGNGYGTITPATATGVDSFVKAGMAASFAAPAGVSMAAAPVSVRVKSLMISISRGNLYGAQLVSKVDFAGVNGAYNQPWSRIAADKLEAEEAANPDAKANKLALIGSRGIGTNSVTRYPIMSAKPGISPEATFVHIDTNSNAVSHLKYSPTALFSNIPME